MEPILDLVAVVYNAPDETEAFLASLNKVDVPFTCTLIDNNSPDPRILSLLIDWQAQKKPKNMIDRSIIFKEQNVGYARACNLGASKGKARYLALLNCDTEFIYGNTSKIIDLFEEDSSIGIIGPLTYGSDGKITHGGIFKDTNSGRDLHRGWMVDVNIAGDAVKDTCDVPTVSGATYFARRSMWDELTTCPLYREAAGDSVEGAFLPTPHFYEETWCSYHARAHDYRVVYLGSAEMIHQWHRSSPIGSVSLEPAESMFRDACKVHGIELTF